MVRYNTNASGQNPDDDMKLTSTPSRLATRDYKSSRHIITQRTSSKKRKPSNEEIEYLRREQRLESFEQVDFICKQCRKINFKQVLDLDSKTLQASTEGIYIADLGTRCNSLSEDSCVLCQVFAAVRVPASLPLNSTRYQLRAYSFLKHNSSISFKHLSATLRSEDAPCLAVVSGHFASQKLADEAKRVGHLLCTNKKISPHCFLTPQAVPRQWDASRATSWLKYCQSYHQKLCSTTEKRLQGMKVIDCNSMVVIPTPPGCSYAALSYLWGHSNDNRNHPETPYTDGLPMRMTSLPKVISDAIIVAKTLRFRYLWVDKLCIDQDNKEEKHEQIIRMDAIYRRAELTIIAAAGDDENYGLPGVGTTPRKLQPMADLGNIQIISTIDHPHDTITSSKWATRGWTYQEAVLSRRRLVFTDSQMYFECNGMNCHESLQADFDAVHARNKHKALMFMHSGIFTGSDCFRPQEAKDLEYMENLQSYFEHVRQYSKRSLSYEEDSFKAFAGIASYFERSRHPIPHIWGLPVTGTRSDLKFIDLDLALFWRHKHNCWSDSRKPKRRSLFPSWSWVGWAGEVDFVATPEMLRKRIKSRGELKYNRNASINPFDTTLPFKFSVIKPSLVTIKNPSILTAWNIAGDNATLSLSRGPKNAELILQRFRARKWELVKLSVFRGYRSYLDRVFLVIERETEATGKREPGLSYDIPTYSASRVGLMTIDSRAKETSDIFVFPESHIRLV